jgi:uroporphyrinogen-III synthase
VRFFEALISPEQAVPVLAAVGARTAGVLEEAGLHVSLVPEKGFTSEDLLAMSELQEVAGRRVLIIKGEGGRRLIADTLRARGAEVDEISVYRRCLPQIDAQSVHDQTRLGAIDLITLTSVETVDNLVTLLGEAMGERLYDIPVVAGSVRIAARATELGFKSIVQAENPSDESMSDAVLQWIKSDRA